MGERNVVMQEEGKMSPQEYFNVVKEKKHSIDDEQLKAIYDNCLELLNKYVTAGQIRGAEKLMFHISCIEKEREIVKMGITTFVYRDDIEFYISNVASDVVKIIDIESYEREIPDEIVEIIGRVKGKFDQLYIVFTDYTGTVERQVEQERRQKDPILFGTFQNGSTRSVIDRFYYLGDWIDEYCDLTLDKMVNETKNVGKRNIVRTIKTPEDIAELKEQLKSIKTVNNTHIVIADADLKQQKKGFFHSVRTFFTRKK